jgi:hypothetical protein
MDFDEKTRERSGCAMRVITAGLAFSVLFIMLMPGPPVPGQGQTLNPANLIALNAQGQQGQFNGPHVSVNYSYVRTGGDMQLTGNVQFGMTIQANYAGVQSFNLSLALVDARGNVLGEQGLIRSFYSNVGDTLNFNTSVAVPPQTAFMAFTYSGQAYAAGPGSPAPINFSFSPFAD